MRGQKALRPLLFPRPGRFDSLLVEPGPPALLTLAMGRAWGRIRATGLGPVIMEGVAPLTVGLVLASGWTLARAQGLHPLMVAITAIAAMGALYRASAAMWLLALGAGASVMLG